MFAMIGCSSDNSTDLNFITVGSYYVYECDIELRLIGVYTE